MDTSTVLEKLGPRRDRRGRALLRDADRESLLAGLQASGLTQRAYAQMHGINYNTFVAWLAKWRLGRPAGAPVGGFLEVTVAGKSSALLEWALTDGTVVRGAPSDLAVLMKEHRG
jgi:hypothetical protein